MSRFEIEIPLAVLDKIEEVLPAEFRFHEKRDPRPHLVLYLEGDTPLKLVGLV